MRNWFRKTPPTSGCQRCGRADPDGCPSPTCPPRRDTIRKLLVEDAVAKGSSFNVYRRAKALTGDEDFAFETQNEASRRVAYAKAEAMALKAHAQLVERQRAAARSTPTTETSDMPIPSDTEDRRLAAQALQNRLWRELEEIFWPLPTPDQTKAQKLQRVEDLCARIRRAMAWEKGEEPKRSGRLLDATEESVLKHLRKFSHGTTRENLVESFRLSFGGYERTTIDVAIHRLMRDGIIKTREVAVTPATQTLLVPADEPWRD